VVMSLFVARMITPLIAAYFLRSHGTQDHASGKAMNGYLRVLRWSLDTRRADAYRAANPGRRGRFLAWFRDHRVWMVGVGQLALLATLALLFTLPMTFQPEADQNFANVQIKLAPGATLAETTAVTGSTLDDRSPACRIESTGRSTTVPAKDTTPSETAKTGAPTSAVRPLAARSRPRCPAE